MTLKKGIPAQALKPYYVGGVTVRLNRATGDGTPDTIRYPRMTVAYYKPIRLKNGYYPKISLSNRAKSIRLRPKMRHNPILGG